MFYEIIVYPEKNEILFFFEFSLVFIWKRNIREKYTETITVNYLLI